MVELEVTWIEVVLKTYESSVALYEAVPRVVYLYLGDGQHWIVKEGE